MNNLLLIGDDTLTPYLRALQADGFDVALLAPGAAFAATVAPDAVIIDLSTASEDPLARRYLEKLADGEAPPIMTILNRAQLDTFDPTTAAAGFVLAGAPAEELCARVRQVLFHRHGVDARNILKCGDLVMDLASYTVQIGGRPVELTYKEYELLRFLATNRGRVYTRETLLNKVWGYDFYGGARTVDVHIRRLRAKIEDRHAPFIETVRNVGYRFRTS